MTTKNKLKKILILPLFLSFLFLFTSSRSVFADNSSDIVQYQIVSGENISDGHIVSLSKGQYTLSNKEYDVNAAGVIDTSPSLSLDLTQTDQSYPIASSGHVEVLVNETNGPIKAGDLITTSSTPGVGMKATKKGATIGQAIEDLSPENDNKTGQITVALNFNTLGPVGEGEEKPSAFERLKETLAALISLKKPPISDQVDKSLKYFLASAVLLLSVGFAFFNFARTSRGGIDAIGRNPLASKVIFLGISLTAVITVFILGAGFILAYFILAL